MKQSQNTSYSEVDLSWMIGRAIKEVSFHEPTRWNFSFGSKTNFSVECLWRIVEIGRIVLCSEDHGQKFGLPVHIDAAAKSTEFLAARSVKAVRLRDATADLTIEFDGNCLLEIIPDSSGYESWQANEPSGVYYVAQGGGNIVKFNPQAGS